MATVNVELTFDQLLAAVRRLPTAQKTKLWQALDAELNRYAVRRRAREEFAQAVETIRAANEGVTEDEVMADVTAAVQEVRAARRARSG